MFEEPFTADCRIYNLLQNAPRHLSFHTPGHKEGKWDITELSFSDNLSAPKGVLKAAQEDAAKILGADESFFLTDGSTCGVMAMIYACGAKRILFPSASHKSVYNACELMRLKKTVIKTRYFGSVPQQPTADEIARALEKTPCGAVVITSPDYYGNVADLAGIRAVCDKFHAVLLCDGAHGSHLHGTPLHAGKYADMWVDGVHKSLPAFTQGAVVSAKGAWCAPLARAVDIFRTSSPSYPILASIEYALKYPKNPDLKRAAQELKERFHAYPSPDYTKIVISYGEDAPAVAKFFEERGVYPEFCDGVNILFYLSPATKKADLERLCALLETVRPLQKEGGTPETKRGKRTKKVARVPLEDAVGETCAAPCGLFPPCIPLIEEGQTVTEEAAKRLMGADNEFGLIENKIAVYVK